MGVWDNGVLVHFLASFAVASFIDPWNMEVILILAF